MQCTLRRYGMVDCEQVCGIGGVGVVSVSVLSNGVCMNRWVLLRRIR